MHTRELIERKLLEAPWWVPAPWGLSVVKARDLPDGALVVAPSGIFVGLRPLTFHEQVVRDCGLIVRRGLLARWWGEEEPDPPTGRQILRELDVPHPPETPYPALSYEMYVSPDALRHAAIDLAELTREHLANRIYKHARLDAAVLAPNPTLTVTWLRPDERDVNEYNQPRMIECPADDPRATRIRYELYWPVERFEEGES